MLTHRLMTRCLTPEQSAEMFDWLDERRSLIHSIEHSTLEDLYEMFDLFPGVPGLLDGPWLIILEDEADDVVFFKLKWC